METPTPTRPLPVRELAALIHSGPTPAEKWLRNAKRTDIVLPVAAAAVMMIVAIAVVSALTAMAVTGA